MVTDPDPGTTGDAGGAAEPREETHARLEAYTYLTVPDRMTYMAIMRLFVTSLLVDFSAPEVAAQLAAGGIDLDADTVTDKLNNLVGWGNLLRSSHTVRVSSIREYQRARARFQLSRLGERVQRSVEDLLGSADAAREVSRQMLALVARGLAELADMLERPGGIGLTEATERIGTIFVQFAEFADSVRDFYAYLGSVLSRYDLDSADYTGFKDLLLDYIESITEEVSMLAPRVAGDLRRCWPHLPELLARVDTADPGLSGLTDIAPGTQVRRAPGRDLADWEALRGWFESGSDTPSEVDSLRSATLRALQSLLANAKRMIRSAGGEVSRRRDLLRLARWFDDADQTEAEDLFCAAFGLYGARHVAYAIPPDMPVPASVSWWHGPEVDVPVSLRERGTRAARGRTAGVEDHRAQKEKLLVEAAEIARAREAAAAELRGAAGRLGEARLSAPALSLLLELLASALGAARARPEPTSVLALEGAYASAKDVDLALAVTRQPGATLTLHSTDGELSVDGLRLDVGPGAAIPAAGGRAAPGPGAAVGTEPSLGDGWPYEQDDWPYEQDGWSFGRMAVGDERSRRRDG